MADALKTKIEVGLAGKTTVMEVEIPAGDPPPYKVGERPVTGKRRPRLDGPQMVTGRAAYTHDARRPGMLHARILRSPHAHAKIVSIDTSALEKMPGVVFENPGKDTVRYHGDAVLALAAPTRAAAEDALRAVKVVYDVLPHTVSLAAARKEGSPLVFQKFVEEKHSAGDVPGGAAPVQQRGNVRGPKTSGRGDADKGFAEAEGTLEVVTTTAVQTHVPLETHSLFAEWVGDTLEVQASTQGTFSVRDELAEVLKLQKNKVNVRAEFTGGGFGAKFGAGDYGVFAAKLAKKAGRPVLMALDRKEEHLAAGNRPDSWNRVKLGYKNDGTVTAVDYESFGTAGVAPGSQVIVRIHRDGTVEAENGVQDIGGGVRTPIAMVVAEELGLPVAKVNVKIGDSRYPFGPASGGSVTTGSLIPAVRAAAVHAKEKLLDVASRLLGAPASEIALTNGVFSAKGKSADFRKVCSRLPGETLVATGDRAKDYDGADTRLFGAQFAEVVVDVETGVVGVKKVVAVHDCGQPVWKTGVESQIRGGILQGISYALFEERVVDERSGRVLNPNVEFYKILGSKDTPEIVPLIVDHYPGKNNAHARGIGEPATVPTAAAVANAIAHATGIRPTALPITPAKILDALGKVPKREVRA